LNITTTGIKKNHPMWGKEFILMLPGNLQFYL
jgi:hypothetical protein